MCVYVYVCVCVCVYVCMCVCTIGAAQNRDVNRSVRGGCLRVSSCLCVRVFAYVHVCVCVYIHNRCCPKM